MPRASQRSKPNYRLMLEKISAIGREWRKTFTRLQKKQRAILQRLGKKSDTKTLAKLRRTLAS